MSFQRLKDYERAVLPSQDEISAYEQKGWYVSPMIIPDELIESAKKGAYAIYRGEKNRDCPPIEGPANDTFDETKVLMNNEYACMQRSEIWDLVSMPVISAIAARLARTHEIRLFADALMCKFPSKNVKEGVFGWHTDKAYWPSCSSNDMLTAWIPLQDVTIDMGPMHVIENSQNWEMDEALKSYCAAGIKDLTALEMHLKQTNREYRNVPMTLKKGQLSFHNANTFHGSSANTTSIPRMTLTIHMQDASNVHVPAFNKNGDRILIGYERLAKKDDLGNPDYRDPAWFPVLWSEANGG